MDTWTIAAITSEIRGQLLGGRVQEIVQADEWTVGLVVYNQGERRPLQITVEPEHPRLYLVEERLRRGVDEPTPLLLLLRKYVRDSRLTAVTQPPFERAVQLEFQHHEEGTTTLVAELVPRRSNLLLVDAEGTILDLLRRVGPRENRARTLLPGRPYVEPPQLTRLNPFNLDTAALHRLLSEAEPKTPLWRVLLSRVQGFSPLLAQELAYRALGDVEACLDATTSTGHLMQVTQALGNLLLPLASETWEPCLARREETIIAYAPYRLTHLETRAEIVAVSSTSQAALAYYTQQEAVDAYASARHNAQILLDEAIGRMQTRLESLRRQLVAPEDLEKLRLPGDWILAYTAQIAPEQRELVVDTGEEKPLRIRLDPDLTAVENAQTYFRRYTRAKRAANAVPPLIAATEEELDYLRQLQADLEMAENAGDIAEVRGALAEAGYLREDRDEKRATPRSAPSKPLQFRSPDGFVIVVGRNARQNEQVTFKMAAADDPWMHVLGVPGAHVIVRANGRPVPQTTLQRAAELAAFFSSARGEAHADVTYTQRKFVRRPSGGRPGQALVRRSETLGVRPVGPKPGEAL